MNDAFNLKRFVDAQEDGYSSVLEELTAGRKRSHWMWYIFPQIQGLGSSPTSQHYALRSAEEAAAYLNHPVLGPRLQECTQLVLNVEGGSAEQIFGHPDDLKFRSCMTLCERAAADPSLFRAALLKYFGGEADPLTARILDRQ